MTITASHSTTKDYLLILEPDLDNDLWQEGNGLSRLFALKQGNQQQQQQQVPAIPIVGVTSTKWKRLRQYIKANNLKKQSNTNDLKKLFGYKSLRDKGMYLQEKPIKLAFVDLADSFCHIDEEEDKWFKYGEAADGEDTYFPVSFCFYDKTTGELFKTIKVQEKRKWLSKLGYYELASTLETKDLLLMPYYDVKVFINNKEVTSLEEMKRLSSPNMRKTCYVGSCQEIGHICPIVNKKKQDEHLKALIKELDEQISNISSSEIVTTNQEEEEQREEILAQLQQNKELLEYWQTTTKNKEMFLEDSSYIDLYFRPVHNRNIGNLLDQEDIELGEKLVKSLPEDLANQIKESFFHALEHERGNL